jgi:heat shock protein HslJ
MPFKIFAAVLTVGVFVCSGCGGGPGEQERGKTARTAGVPTETQISNLAYSGVYEGTTVTLRDGRYEGEPFAEGGASRPTLEWVDRLYGLGDLTGDGINDAAVFLAENSGGSGVRLYLAAVSIENGQPANLGTALIGDRVQVRSIDIVDGKVWLDIVEQGPEDAACCPSQLARKAWELMDGSLVETAVEITGRLSLALLLETEWVLTHFNLGEPAPAEPEITIAFEEGKIAGSSGCNRYFTSIEETSPGEIRVGLLASSRRDCPRAIKQAEYSYVMRLTRIQSYGFLMGKLALGWQSNDGWHGTMLFARRPPTPPVP